MPCFDCDKLLTRAAGLAHFLRKKAYAAHVAGRHSERNWEKCPYSSCKEWANALRTAGIEEDSKEWQEALKEAKAS